jgi:hypothetical protein
LPWDSLIMEIQNTGDRKYSNKFQMEKFDLSHVSQLPEFSGSGVYTGVFFNEEVLLTGGYRGKNSSVHFVIECYDGNINDIKLQGVNIKQIKISHPIHGEKLFIDYCPAHADFTENVIIICNEIINSIEGGELPHDATRRILQKWGYFLLKPRTNMLSEEEITGLFGELLTIEWFLEQGKDESALIDKWLGPLKNPRDFEFEKFWIEVKSTKRRDNQVEIHGIEQLEASDTAELYLWLNVLERDTKSRSLVELINEIDDKVTSALVAMNYRDKLHQCGYHAADAGYYNNERFKCDRISIYHINDEFPKITRDMLSLPARVTSLSYGLDLNGIDEVKKETIFGDEL